MSEDTFVTYVIEYPGTNLVKVGQAKYFVDRFAQLKTASPVDPQVVCVFRGASHEQELHALFGHLRHHGEFFHYTRELQEYIKSSTKLNAHRMTQAEAEAMSPRIKRSSDAPRRERSEAEAIKADEMGVSLETNE